MTNRLRLFAVVFVLAFFAPARAATMKAGVARVDITPPTGELMWGFFNRKTPAQGVRDPLFARALVLEAGGKRLALVALDLGRPFGPASLARLRDAAKKDANVDDLLVVASHTHSGPVIQDVYPDGTPAWESADLEKIEKAIQQAASNLVDAQLGTGYGVTYIGHNRLRLNPDGTVTWFEKNPTMVPTAPVDPTVSVLRVDRSSDGSPIAILVNYSCHPVIYGSDNLEYSADFPGVMTETVEKAFAAEGQHPLCIFLQGAPGDINPYYAVTPIEQDAVARCRWTGEHLGEEAARVAMKIHTTAAPDPSLDFSEDVLTFHLRWNPAKFRAALLKEIGPKAFQVYAPMIEEELHLPVTTLLINKKIAFMGMPGEPFVDFQMDWRNRCPVHDAFFLGYANGYYGYFPTLRAATLGGYGANGMTTWVEVGAGEHMVNHALVRTYEFLGRLKDMPDGMD